MRNASIALLAPDRWFSTSFDNTDRERLLSLGWSGRMIGEEPDRGSIIQELKSANIAITSWDSLQFDSEMLAEAPKLELICHAAGSVKCIVCPDVWERNIHVVSAAPAIAIGVGEHSLGLMLSAMKNCYEFNRLMKKNIDTAPARERIVETYGITVGVIGCGFTGKHFIRLLDMFELSEILVYDPHLSDQKANELGVRKVALNELLSDSHVIALHAPRLDETKHLLNADNLKLLKDNAILVNTASGSLIDENALIQELKKRPIIAALDVSCPEPPKPDSELRKLPNVILTPHIAGAAANNRFRIGNLVINEIERFLTSRKLKYEVKSEDLLKIA